MTPLSNQLWVGHVCTPRVYGTPADPMPPVWRPTRLAALDLRMRVGRATALPLPLEETSW